MADKETIEQAWGVIDSIAAEEQGWGIFMTEHHPNAEKSIVNGKPYGHRLFELQCSEEAGVFANDEEAHAFVRAAAQKGDTLATRALDFLKSYSPVEYDAVMAVAISENQGT